MKLTDKFKKQTDGKIAIVDADSLIYRVSFAHEKDGVLTGSKADAIDMLHYLIEDITMRCRATDIEFHLTSGRNFRYDKAVTVPYKGNRKDLDKPRLYSDILKYFLTKLKAKLHTEIEADDAVRIRSVELGDRCVIVAVDKDLLMCKGLHYNYVKGEFQRISELDGYRNFYTQMLTGDKSDNILGLKGIGAVKAGKILVGCENEEDMLQATLEAYRQHGLSDDRFVENTSLLWLLEYEGQDKGAEMKQRIQNGKE